MKFRYNYCYEYFPWHPPIHRYVPAALYAGVRAGVCDRVHTIIYNSRYLRAVTAG